MQRKVFLAKCHLNSRDAATDRDLLVMKAMRKPHRNSASIYPIVRSRDPQESTHLGLLIRLQKTLEIDTLLDVFMQQLETIFPLIGLRFYFRDQSVATANAHEKGVREQVDMIVDEQRIGFLEFTLGEKLSPAALHRLVEFSYLLAYPLQHAIEFQHMKVLAVRDSLTGLYNRFHYEAAASQLFQKNARSCSPFSLMLLDLNRFKNVNDTHGHATGDSVLVVFAKVLQESVRDTDQVFRIGGDEFAILLNDSDEHVIGAVEKRIHPRVSESEFMAKYRVTTSIGCATVNTDDSLISLFERADQKLYRMKK